MAPPAAAPTIQKNLISSDVGLLEPSSEGKQMFPDKKREPNSGRFPSGTTPTAREMLERRRRSISRSSSGDESASFRRMTSFGSATGDNCNSLKFAIKSPRHIECRGDYKEPPSVGLLFEVSKDRETENRPPSPRPNDSNEVFVEYNKQILVWDDWYALKASSMDNEFVSARYKRSASKNMPKALPKVTDLDQSDDNSDL